MSADSFASAPMLASATGTHLVTGRLGWSVLIAVGVTTVAGAAWYGYQHQLNAASPEADVATLASATPRTPAASVVRGPVSPAQRTSQASPLRPNRQNVRAPMPAGSAPAQADLRWPLWEFQLRQPIPPRDPPLTPPPWRLIGATLSKSGWQVVILRQGNASPEYFAVGAVLPGGYRIRAITDEDVTFDINKREVILSYTGSR